MKNPTTNIKKLLLLAGDVFILFAALGITLRLRYGADLFFSQWQIHLLPFILVFALWIVILYISELYDIQKAKNNVHFYRQFFYALIISGAIAIGFFYVIPFFRIAPKTNLVIVLGLFAVLFTIWRMSFNHFIAPRLLRRRLLFVGRTNEVDELVKIFQNDSQLGYLPVAIVDLSENKKPNLSEVETYSSLQHIRAIVTAHEIDMVVLSIDIHEQHELTQELYELIFWNLDITNFGTLYEHITGRVPLSALSESWFLENLRPGHVRLYDMFRMSFDSIIAIVILVITGVLLPLLALLIKSTSPGPLFIKQKRIGKNSKTFTIYKFRTMHALGKDGSAEINGAEFAKTKDNRVTKIGKFLRKTRIDEFPQALNILKSEMSLIGPRPERPEFVKKIEQDMPFYTVRHIVRPGITGWAQINYPYAKSLEELLVKLQYDLYYIKNRSIMIDAAIFLKTINILFRRKGL